MITLRLLTLIIFTITFVIGPAESASPLDASTPQKENTSPRTITPSGAPPLPAGMITDDKVLEILENLDITPDQPEMTPQKFQQIKRKVQIFPVIAKNINQGTNRTISLSEWKKILLDMGIEPSRELSDDAWGKILAQLGIQKESLKPEPTPPILVENPSEANPVTGVNPPEPQNKPPQPVEVEGPPVELSKRTSPVVSKKTTEEMKRLRNQTITLSLRGMNIIEVLRTISQRSGMNIVAGAKVKGKVTIFLQNVEILEALRLILESNNLAYILDGDIVRVMTEAEFQKKYGYAFSEKIQIHLFNLKYLKPSSMEKFLKPFLSKVGKVAAYDWSNTLVLIETPNKIQEISQLLSDIEEDSGNRVFKINYASIEKILPKISPYVTKDLGSIEADTRSKQIYIRDSLSSLKKIEKLIHVLDARPREVQIEAKIIQIDLNKNFQFGVDWSAIFDRGQVTVDGVAQPAKTVKVEAPLTPVPTSGFNAIPGAQGVTATINKFDFMGLTQDTLKGIINALEVTGDVDVLSAPRVTVIEGEKAHIHVGTKEAKITSTTSQNATGNTISTIQVEEVPVGITLSIDDVRIGDDGYVYMHIKPEVSSVDRTVTTGSGGQQQGETTSSVPIIQTANSETHVIIKNGHTLLLGGLIEDKVEKKINRVPILGWIPLIGWFFRSYSSSKSKSEIAILLTPTIVNPGKDSLEVAEYLNVSDRKQTLKEKKWVEKSLSDKGKSK